MYNYLLIAILILTSSSFGQIEVSTVYFGTCLIDFSTYPFQVVSTNAYQSRESAASICDNNGNILFYSNGGVSPTSPAPGGVWDASNQLLPNGSLVDSAGCLSSYNGAVVVPLTSSSKSTNKVVYYLLTRDCIESSFSTIQYNSGLTYATIDTIAGGELAVTSKYNALVPYEFSSSQSTNYEPLAVALASDSNSYWVFSYNKDSLYRFRFSETGISSFQYIHPLAKDIITVSPKLDYVIAGKYLFAFDHSNGDMNLVHTFQETYRHSFSPNGRFLYLVENGQLKQYDLSQPIWLGTPVVLGSAPIFSPNFLAPDGKIYFFTGEQDHFDAVIHCPNELGTACSYETQELSLMGGYTAHVRPNIPAHYLYKGTGCEVGLEESIHPESIRFFPNPTSEQLTVEGITEKMIVELYSLLGENVLRTEISPGDKIDIHNLHPGVYHLHIEGKHLGRLIVSD